MSIDRSLRLKSSLERHRNVLTRAERLAMLQEEDKWGERSSALHLPKIAHRKAKAKKKAAAKADAATAEAAAAPAQP
jgi:small basic protein (TIGR04137 family)